MRTDELDFDLPPELIAQEPPADRSAARLLTYSKQSKVIGHQAFSDLPGLLRAGDLLVFNDTRVLPARFMLRKLSGGAIEGLFLREVRLGRWLVLLKGLENYRGPLRFDGDESVTATSAGALGGGQYEIDLCTHDPAETILRRVGKMPLPPYIKRDKQSDPRDDLDRDRYQTVYASQTGSVAAPTAGLHFTPRILEALDSRGIERTFVTLHVGLGTFKPVFTDTLAEHPMHCESYEIGPSAAEALNRARSSGRRIVAVGTTSARVLESHPAEEAWALVCAETSIFIYPPYPFRHVGALITNFHLPRSTLIALVAAFVSLEEQRRIYADAIARRYRFFSYGDVMLLE